MVDVAVEYYSQKYGNDVKSAFIHAVRELGELARAVERDQRELAAHEITEIAALMKFLAVRYDFDLEEKVASLYTKKLEKLEGS
ncbi:MAG: hypothetical protein V3U52_05925 [Thermoplasmata archaeon]